MSEYQFYEFRAVDKPLTSAQMKELRKYSTRAEITPTGFKNEYHYGSFKGSETEWMEKYFDAHVYVSNWGTCTFILRLPAGTLSDEALYEFGNDESFSWSQAGNHLILSWSRMEEEAYDDVYEDEGWMGRLLPIRDELIRGDHRSLYLGWLAGIYETEAVEAPAGDSDAEDEDFLEPPVPSGLQSLTEAQQALTEFLYIDQDLVSAAASGSVPDSSGPSDAEAAQWVAGLSEQELRAAVSRMILDDGPAVQRDLQVRFYRWRAQCALSSNTNVPARRRSDELFALAEAEEKIRTKREREAKEKAEAKRLAAAVPHIPHMWETVYELAQKTTGSAYDKVSSLLVEIRDASKFAGSSSQFELDLDRFLSNHSSRALRNRLDRAGIDCVSAKLRLVE